MTRAVSNSSQRLRVAMVSGNRPPDACGVGDYTESLSMALAEAGVQVELVNSPGPDSGKGQGRAHDRTGARWGFARGAALLRQVAQMRPDIVHLQYPTAAYGAGLAPQVLSMTNIPLVVTLHEASGVHVLRKAALYPFLIRAQALVATTSYEAAYLRRLYPPSVKRTQVVPIGSSIPAAVRSVVTSVDIVYFGLIAPRKGIEDFLTAAAISRSQDLPWRFVVLGKVATGAGSFFDRLRREFSEVGVAWDLNRGASEVAQVLSTSAAAYLPFPDGASGRRSSLAATLLNGVPTITTVGPATPMELVDGKNVLFASTPIEAIRRLGELDTSPRLARSLSAGASRLGESMRWDSIAAGHLSVYSKLLKA